jgi:uncharacterized membrane protein
MSEPTLKELSQIKFNKELIFSHVLMAFKDILDKISKENVDPRLVLSSMGGVISHFSATVIFMITKGMDEESTERCKNAIFMTINQQLQVIKEGNE